MNTFYPESTKYNSIDLPLKVFIDALIDFDYSQIEDFDIILEQFYESIGGKELVNQMTELKELAIIRSRIQLAYSIIELIPIKPTVELFELLKKLEFHALCPNANMEDMNAYVEAVMPFIKREEMDLRKADKDRLAAQQGKEGQPYTRDYFVDMLIEISTAFKVSVNDNISVREYCRWVNKYKNYIEHLEKQNNKAL